MRRASCIGALLICIGASSSARALAGSDLVVFDDAFVSGVTFQAFFGSKLDALSIDSTVSYLGTSSLRILVPAPGDPLGSYAGGAVVASVGRDLTAYNALSFWVKASQAMILDVVGLGNDNTGASDFEARRSSIPVATNWMQVAVPIPLAAKLDAERGLFFFAEGPEAAGGHTLWIDEVRFGSCDCVTNVRPAVASRSVSTFAGASLSLKDVADTRTVFDVNGADVTVTHMHGYFTFLSSNPAVAQINGDAIDVLGEGIAVVTARLDAIDATGSVTIQASAGPSSGAPTPSVPPGDVLSLFSNAYASVPVNTWSALWDRADVDDIVIAGNDAKVYTNVLYAGIEFTSPVLDVSAMTRFHMDVWAPSGSVFRIKLVDFGTNGVYGGGDDSECELSFNAGTDPPFTTGAWVAIDVPLDAFVGLNGRAHLAQLILSGDVPTFFVDNVFFHRAMIGVNDPSLFDFALQGAIPNPTRCELRVSLSLPDSRPASLAVFDLQGRRVAERSVDGVGPGRHVVSLDGSDRLPAGLYLIRLSQDGRSLTRRAVVLRR